MSSFTPTAAQISVGDTLYFKVVTSKISAEVGANSVSSKGINFLGDNYPQGTIIQVYVNLVGEGMNGNFTIDGKSMRFGYPVDSFLTNIFPRFLEKTSQLTSSLIGFWDREYFEEGFSLYLYPYIDPIEESWISINNTGNAMVAELESYEELGLELEYSFLLKDKNNKIYFETWNKGEITSQFEESLDHPYSIPANYSFENRFQIVFDKSSGQMLGMHMKGETNGEIAEGSVRVKLDYKIEKVGYNLPWFKIENTASILIAILVPTVAVGAVIPTVVVIRKRRKNREKLPNHS